MRIILSLLAVLALAARPIAGAGDSGPWAELARRDLEAIRRLVEANHPGPVDEENPAFRLWLEEGFREASALERWILSLARQTPPRKSAE